MMLRKSSCAVAVGAALLASASTAVADGPYEPNESITQSHGPMAGGAAHNAAIETSNDEDWFYFYTSGQRQFEVVLTYQGHTPGSDSSVGLTLRGRDGNEIGYAYVNRYDDERIGRITFTSSGSERYNLSATGDEGVKYSVQVNPADALTSEPPVQCFNHVHTSDHIHVTRHIHRRRHRHRSGRIHIHRRVHRHRWLHTHSEDHLHCEPAPRLAIAGALGLR